MSPGEIAYLSLVVIAALIFIVTLAWESWRNP
jgi:hypothetical protein